ncbi:MAG: hypothetical protein HY026_03695 [Deltaproteobacteria bacterium]|nr:hypothetical protein [Deltaproteobacteria bacterium]
MYDKEKDTTWLIDVFKVVGAIAGSLSGAAVLFAVIGYIIVLSFIQEMNLYGLANFPREFFMEADLRFISDVSGFFGDHLILGPCAFLISFSASLVSLIYSHKKTMLKWVSLILTVVVVLITFKLGAFSEDGQRFILYAVSTPFLIALIIYLAMNINQFARPGDMVKSSYLSFVILFLLLVLSIPVSYGRHIYDLDVYSISAFEYQNKYENDSIKRMRDNITKGKGEVYYLMGHTAGKEIFFIPTANPKRMVIIDREAIDFIGIIRDPSGKTQTLRRILSPPIPAAEEKEKTLQPVSGKEKKEFEKLF